MEFFVSLFYLPARPCRFKIAVLFHGIIVDFVQGYAVALFGFNRLGNQLCIWNGGFEMGARLKAGLQMLFYNVAIRIVIPKACILDQSSIAFRLGIEQEWIVHEKLRRMMTLSNNANDVSIEE
jgi:hypothetical protein